MICRLSGKLVGVSGTTALLEVGGVWYEVMVPAAALAVLQRLTGNDVALFTLQYLEGNPAGANLVPRIVGFLSESDREFFNLFTKVKGISIRRALKAMSIPCHHIAAAIEHGDERLLTTLSEIGKKTAAQIVTELRGHMQRFLAPSAAPLPMAELTDAQRIAVDILVSWGDRRADAQRWVAVAVESDPQLIEPDAIVRSAYRLKNSAGR